MQIDWQDISDELLFLIKNKNYNLKGLNPITIDSLYGSMYGYNIRYQSLEKALSNEWERLIVYAYNRVNKLTKSDNFTYIKKQPFRARIGIGTYKWNYDPLIIIKAIKLDVSMIDTAEGYGFGRVETELGKILKNYEDTKVQVYTKVSRNHMSPRAITNSMDRSIEKLNIKPHIQEHFPNNIHQDSILYLSDYLNKGKIKSIGLGNCSVDMIEAAQRKLTEVNGTILNSVQISFSLFNQIAKDSVIPYCQDRGISVIAYSPLGQKFNKLDKKALFKIAKKYNASVSQVALSWILNFEGVIPIPQTNNIKHLEENILSNYLILDKKDIKYLSKYYEKLR